jgi:hypothetical protein
MRTGGSYASIGVGCRHRPTPVSGGAPTFAELQCFSPGVNRAVAEDLEEGEF